YAAIAWLIVQVTTQTFPFFEIPNWAVRLVILLAALGFPIALVIAWAFELTPEGIKRTDEVPRQQPGGRAWIAIALAALAISAAVFFLGRYTAPQAPALAAAAVKSIAVLPFENRSEDKANAYFADGIQDEILTRLAQIEDLKVISRTSTQRYKSSPDNIPEIARQLGVANILEGSVQKAGEQVRVNVQLIEAASDRHIWAEAYDRKLTDIFAVQSEIAGNIARALQLKLSGREAAAVAEQPTGNPEAYDAYLRGLVIWNRLTNSTEELLEMVGQFERATQLDPQFAVAWAYLSLAQTFLYAELERTPERLASGREALGRAEALQPDRSEVHLARAMYEYRARRDYEAALAALEKARKGSADVEPIEFAAYVKRRQGKWEDAVKLHAEALELDPRNPLLLSEAAVTHRALRRFSEMQALIEKALAIEPNSPDLLVQLSEAALAQGQPKLAAEYLARIPPDAQQPTIANARYNYYLLQRQFGEASVMLRKLLDSAPPKRLAGLVRARLGVAEALVGNTTVAQEELTRARSELLALRDEGDRGATIGNTLVVIAGFLKDKAAVEREAALLQETITQDKLDGPFIEASIAMARAQLGETERAITMLEELLSKPGEDALTPALLRADPRWDPLRRHPRFHQLAQPAR
ncbi:MAG TPA: tetratricopeptide repeat protein, partial [Chthoniobacterales bacterium]|nr:tetratricopeptide repeat protein [Chthoniobacterales bacterium]